MAIGDPGRKAYFRPHQPTPSGTIEFRPRKQPLQLVPAFAAGAAAAELLRVAGEVPGAVEPGDHRACEKPDVEVRAGRGLVTGPQVAPRVIGLVAGPHEIGDVARVPSVAPEHEGDDAKRHRHEQGGVGLLQRFPYAPRKARGGDTRVKVPGGARPQGGLLVEAAMEPCQHAVRVRAHPARSLRDVRDPGRPVAGEACRGGGIGADRQQLGKGPHAAWNRDHERRPPGEARRGGLLMRRERGARMARGHRIGVRAQVEADEGAAARRGDVRQRHRHLGLDGAQHVVGERLHQPPRARVGRAHGGRAPLGGLSLVAGAQCGGDLPDRHQLPMQAGPAHRAGGEVITTARHELERRYAAIGKGGAHGAVDGLQAAEAHLRIAVRLGRVGGVHVVDVELDERPAAIRQRAADVGPLGEERGEPAADVHRRHVRRPQAPSAAVAGEADAPRAVLGDALPHRRIGVVRRDGRGGFHLSPGR